MPVHRVVGGKIVSSVTFFPPTAVLHSSAALNITFKHDGVINKTTDTNKT